MKLGAVLGLYMGPLGALICLLLANLAGLVVGVTLRCVGRETWEVPFAPCLGGAALFVAVTQAGAIGLPGVAHRI